jgi:hypothetical protein
MMRRFASILPFLATLTLPGRILAHEGHEHKVTGTVVQVHADIDMVSHVEVKTTDGKTVVLTCNEKTKFLKGKAVASPRDVQAGTRVVATVTEDGKTMRASEVLVGEGAPPAKTSPPGPRGTR